MSTGPASTEEESVTNDSVQRPKVVKGRAPTQRPDVDTLFSINADGSRNAIHPADVKGRFQVRKHLLWYLMLAIYVAMPWVTIGGHPALLIDIEHRHFYLFGFTFNAQDFWFAFFFVTGLGFTLFVVAALFGRVWCGYACPQTVFLEGVFRRIERWIEGPAASRARLDKAPMTASKLMRRGLKMVVFFALAAIITHSFLGYFVPVADVVEAMTSSPAANPVAFTFIAISTLVLFVNFTWFREQLCIVVCPYGRLQGALYDADTVIVGYDARRGEPRGSATTAGAGDCVDCFRCVAVCPTGIDIRNGTQLECVGCANCIDACDAVMDKLGRPKGLVRYDSQRGLETGVRKFFRGRVVLYVVLLLLGVGAFSLAATTRRPFDAELSRARGSSYTIEQDRIHNVFELHLVNKRPEERQFVIEPVAVAGVEVTLGMREVTLATLADLRVPIHVFIAEDKFQRGMKLELRVRCLDADGQLDVERPATAPLLGPRRR